MPIRNTTSQEFLLRSRYLLQNFIHKNICSENVNKESHWLQGALPINKRRIIQSGHSISSDIQMRTASLRVIVPDSSVKSAYAWAIHYMRTQVLRIS